MGKRIVSMLLALCLCITFLSACGSSDRPAETQTSSTASVSGEQSASEAPDKTGPASTEPVFVKAVGTDEYYYYVYSTYVQINIYRGDGGDVVIPATLENLPVRIIGSDAFSGCINLTAVTIPDSVQEIGVDAFCDTPWLDSFSEEFVVVGDGILIDYNGTKTDVVIPDTVKYISSGFYGNDNITHVSIPNTVTCIGDVAFSHCMYLTEVVIPDSVIEIKNGAFWGCGNLTSVTVPNSVKIIDGDALASPWLDAQTEEFVIVGDGVLLDYNGTETDVVIPDTVKYISSAFEENKTVTRASIPDTVTGLGSSAFERCKNLTEVTIPNSVTSIGPSAFSKCTNLTEVVIPNSITSIEEWTFNECTNLSKVTIPDSVTYIGHRAFYDTSLAEVMVPSSVTQIVGEAFGNCGNLTIVCEAGSKAETYASRNEIPYRIQ